MRLIVLRHAKAEPRSESGADADRKLLDLGIRQAEFIARALRSTETTPDLLLASPIRRALQTAQIVQRGFATAGTECPLEIDPLLETDRRVSEALAAIAKHADLDTLMMVGHNPQFESLVVRACEGKIPGGVEVLKTGQAVVFDVADPTQVLGSAECIDVLRLDAE